MKKLQAQLLTTVNFGVHDGKNGEPIGVHQPGVWVELPETLALQWSIEGIVKLKSRKANQETKEEGQKQKKDNAPRVPAKKNIESDEHDGSIPEGNQQVIPEDLK